MDDSVQSNADRVDQTAESWTRTVGHLSRSVVKANRAFLTAFGGATPAERKADPKPAAPIVETAYKEADWSFERSVESVDELDIGETVSFTKQTSDEDVREFARISGDTNRLHLEDTFAERTQFGGRIVHGTLLSGMISAALARLPGLTVYLSQTLEFRNPVEIGTTVTANCEIVEDIGGGKYRLTTTVSAEDGDVVIDGEAVVLIDEPPETDEDS